MEIIMVKSYSLIKYPNGVNRETVWNDFSTTIKEVYHIEEFTVEKVNYSVSGVQLHVIKEITLNS